MVKKLNIEDQDRLDKACGDCGGDLDEANRSGWFAFFGDGQIQIELCANCNDRRTKENVTVKSND